MNPAHLARLLNEERRRAAYLEDRVRDLESAASQLEAYAADLSRTYADIRRHAQEMARLHEISARVAASREPEQVLVRVLEALDQLDIEGAAAAYLVEPERVTAADGSDTGEVESGERPPPTAQPRLRATRAALGAEVVLVEGGGEAADGSVVAEALTAKRTVTSLGEGAWVVAVPLLAGGRALGALEIRRVEPLTSTGVLELFAASAAVAVENAYLFQETQHLATTDALTGLNNFRQFHHLLNLEVARARRLQFGVGFLMMDLDHFKEVNDRFLHVTGNVVLRRVADILRTRLRRTDVVGRVGGEEFAAVLPGATIEDVAGVGEKLRRAVAELPPLGADRGEASMPITMSVGGVALPWESVSAESLIRYADSALFQAKRQGRNQVQLWTGENGPAPRHARHGGDSPDESSVIPSRQMAKE